MDVTGSGGEGRNARAFYSNYFLIFKEFQMKQVNKTVLAVALLAAAGSASAALTNGSATGSNSAYLVAFDSAYVNTDSSLGRTYNLDLGVTYNGLKTALTNGTLGSVLNKDLTSDTNWTNFLSGANQANITYAVLAAGDKVDNRGIFLTGTQPVSLANDPGTTPASSTTIVYDAWIDAINTHAAEINTVPGAFGTSSLILGTDQAYSGQADSKPDYSALFGSGQAGQTTFGAMNANVDFWAGSIHYGTVVKRGVTTLNVPMMNQGDIVSAGQVVLTPAGLTAVPLPAAVWLFGAGLMGMLRLNRRKTA